MRWHPFSIIIKKDTKELWHGRNYEKRKETKIAEQKNSYLYAIMLGDTACDIFRIYNAVLSAGNHRKSGRPDGG